MRCGSAGQRADIVPQVARGTPIPGDVSFLWGPHCSPPPDPDQNTRHERWLPLAPKVCFPPPPILHALPPTPASCHIPDLPSQAFLPHHARTGPGARCCPPPTHTHPAPSRVACAVFGDLGVDDKTANPTCHFPAGRRLIEPRPALLPFPCLPYLVSSLGRPWKAPPGSCPSHTPAVW